MWHQFDDAQSATAALVADIRFMLEKMIIEKDHAVMAVSGGASPIPLFEALSEVDIEWHKIQIILVDERYVDPQDPDSNEGLVRRHLLRHHAAKAEFTGLVQQGKSLDEDVRLANKLPVPDLVILGMGEDGHMASLFPHAGQLTQALDTHGEAAARYTRLTPPKAPHERISMTLSALQQADCLILEIQGATKREVLERASLRVSDDYPISHLLGKSWTGARLQIYWHP